MQNTNTGSALIRTLCMTMGLLSLLASAQAADELGFNLRGEFQQGALLRGQVPAGSQVSLNDEPIRVSANGLFVFAFGRDYTGHAKLTVVQPNGRKQALQQAVRKRDWPTQRIDGLPQSKVTPDDGSLERRLSEQKLITAARATQSASMGFAEAFVWPVTGRISGVFGSQRILNGTPKRPHSGVDIARPTGTSVRTPAAGVVTLTENDLYYTGGTVIIDHGLGLSSTLIHLSKIHVEVGQAIAQGNIIGEVGATGRATGPHLHWTMHLNGTKIDPQLLVPDMAEVLAKEN